MSLKVASHPPKCWNRLVKRRVVKRALRCLTFVLWLSGVTLAQERSVLDYYTLALEQLGTSLSRAESEAEASLESLTAAETTFGLLAQETRSEPLRAGIAATFESARRAISRRSGSDLAVQVAVLTGGLQRLVYEAAFAEAASGNLALAQAQLSRLAGDLGLGPDRQAALEEAPLSLLQLQADFEAGVGERVQRLLQQARLEAGTHSRYMLLATAYAGFIPIQDSVHAAAQTTDTFVATITALVEDDEAALEEGLGALEGQIATLISAASASSRRVRGPAVEPTGPAPREALATTSTTSELPPLDEAKETGAERAREEAAQRQAPALRMAGEAPAAPPPVAGLAESLDGEALERVLTAYGAAGYNSPQEPLDALYATAARAVAAAGAGRVATARDLIGSLRSDYERFLQPLLQAGVNTGIGERTLQVIRSLETSPALRPQDLTLLFTQLDAVEAALQSREVSPLQEAGVLTSLLWPASARAVVAIMLAVLAAVPLYLLNLAFGGGNRNWRWVGLALLLLLLPVIYDGLAHLGALVAYATGIGELNVLLVPPYFHHGLQALSTLLAALAILFAGAGFYRIAKEFGLLGKGAASQSGHSSAPPARKPGAKVMDWDEEV